MKEELFSIKQTRETPSGKMYLIKWNKYLSRKFLKTLSGFAREMEWFKTGEYAIRHIENETEVIVGDTIIKHFKQVVSFIADSLEIV